jgi:hypothetical protein
MAAIRPLTSVIQLRISIHGQPVRHGEGHQNRSVDRPSPKGSSKLKANRPINPPRLPLAAARRLQIQPPKSAMYVRIHIPTSSGPEDPKSSVST